MLEAEEIILRTFFQIAKVKMLTSFKRQELNFFFEFFIKSLSIFINVQVLIKALLKSNGI